MNNVWSAVDLRLMALYCKSITSDTLRTESHGNTHLMTVKRCVKDVMLVSMGKLGLHMVGIMMEKVI